MQGSGNVKPTQAVGSFNQSNIPAELLEKKRWCLYNAQKVPFNRGIKFSSSDPATWVSFETAHRDMEHAQAHGIECGGLGFVFCEEDGYVGIDLDHAIDDDGTTKPWAQKILKLFAPFSYSELSPSNTGFHIICRGVKPGAKCKRIIGDGPDAVEMYSKGRYFTMTSSMTNYVTEGIRNAQPQIDKLYKAIDRDLQVVDGGAAAAEQKEEAPQVVSDLGASGEPHAVTSEPCASLSYKDVITAIQASTQAAKFSRLTTGDLKSATADYGLDHSRAVMAITAVVAFYTPDFGVMDQIFRASPLYDAKWAPNPDAVGAMRSGKWARLGLPQFKRIRGAYERKGEVYSMVSGRTSPGEDFSDATLSADKSAGEQEYERHLEIALNGYDDLRVDLFSESLHGLKNGNWRPVFTHIELGRLKSLCAQRGKKFKPARMENYLCQFTSEGARELLIDMPTWDGTDYLQGMSALLSFSESRITTDVFTDILKDWGARMWDKVVRPLESQNRCIILSGAQGIGKDVWAKSLLCGLGDYLADLTLAGKQSSEDKISVVMGSSCVMFISEFDKILKELGVETLKDLITKGSFKQVRKYDRDATTMLNRCSVMAAANPEHILRDVTGNRRFLVFKLAGGPGTAIKWEYPNFDKKFSLQCLAQMRALSEAGYHSSKHSETIMAAITEEYTPEDASIELVLEFEEAISRLASVEPAGLFTLSQLEDVMISLSRTFGLPRRTILCTLKGAGCQFKTCGPRLYGSRAAVKGRRETPPF